MAENGYIAATISYTLYMKGKSFSCDGITSKKIKAIRYAANEPDTYELRFRMDKTCRIFTISLVAVEVVLLRQTKKT